MDRLNLRQILSFESSFAPDIGGEHSINNTDIVDSSGILVDRKINGVDCTLRSKRSSIGYELELSQESSRIR